MAESSQGTIVSSQASSQDMDDYDNYDDDEYEPGQLTINTDEVFVKTCFRKLMKELQNI